MRVQHLASEVVLEAHKQQVDVLNAQPILEPTQLGPAVDALELYPIQGLSFGQTAASSLAQDNLVEQLHLVLLGSLLSIPEAPQTALAIWSEIENSVNGLYQDISNQETSTGR